MAGKTDKKPRRRTQAERRATTQAALLDATLECLVEYGYANTTTTRVVERAGVSRGAQVHHFHTKADLVAAAVVHLHARRAEQLEAEAKRLPGGRDRVTAALDLIWEVHNGPLYAATLELWTAARTDPELHASLVPIEQEMIDEILGYGRMVFGQVAEQPDFEPNLVVAFNAIQGYATAAALLSTKRDRAAGWRRRRDVLATLF